MKRSAIDTLGVITVSLFLTIAIAVVVFPAPAPASPANGGAQEAPKPCVLLEAPPGSENDPDLIIMSTSVWPSGETKNESFILKCPPQEPATKPAPRSPQGEGRVEIPFVMNDCNLPTIKGQLLGETVWMVIDTGSTHTRLDSRFDSIKGDAQILFAGGKYRITVDSPIPLTDYSSERELCGKIDGTVGNDLLAANASITLKYPTDGKTGVLSFVLLDQ